MTSGTTTTKKPERVSGRRKLSSALFGAGAIAVAVAAVGAPYSGWYRDYRDRSRPLTALLAEQQKRVNDPVYLYWLGRRLCDAGRFEEATGVLERGASLDADAPRLREQWTRALLATGKASVAFGQLSEFAARHPDLAAAHYLLGTFHYTLKSVEPARTALERALSLQPRYPQALSLLANLLIAGGENARAETLLRRALVLRPNAALDHLQLAVLRLDSDPQEARRELETAVSLAPQSALCRQKLAAFLLRQGDPAGAEAAARRAIALDSVDPSAHLVLGRALLQGGDAARATPALDAAARLAPGDPVPALELRAARQKLGDREGARRWAEEAERRQKRLAQRRALETRIQTHPTDRVAHESLAGLLASVGDVNGCVREIAVARHERPDAPASLAAAAAALVREGRPREAASLALQVVQQAPNNLAARETLGDAQLALGRLHEAGVAYFAAAGGEEARYAPFARRIAAAQDRLRAAPPPALRLYGRALQAPTPERAEALLREALKADPEHTASLRLLLQLQVRGEADAEALETGKKLLALVPDEGIGSALVAVVLLKKPAGAEVQAQAEELLGLAGADPSAATILPFAHGLLARQRADPKAALAFFQRASTLDPRSKVVWREIVEVATALGDAATASRAKARLAALQ